MNIKKYLKILSAISLAAIIFIACTKDFLDKPPLGALNPSVLVNKNGLDALLTGAYAALDGQSQQQRKMLPMDFLTRNGRPCMKAFREQILY